MTAPERIWLDWPGANRGEPVYDEPPDSELQAGQTGYVRADLVQALVEAASAQLQYMDMCGDKGDLERNLRAILALIDKETGE